MPPHTGKAEANGPSPEGDGARTPDLSQMLNDIEALMSQVHALRRSLREKREAWYKLAEELARDGTT
jgi:hypothetical protein